MREPIIASHFRELERAGNVQRTGVDAQYGFATVRPYAETPGGSLLGGLASRDRSASIAPSRPTETALRLLPTRKPP
jgi:hypothetical protein